MTINEKATDLRCMHEAREPWVEIRHYKLLGYLKKKYSTRPMIAVGYSSSSVPPPDHIDLDIAPQCPIPNIQFH